MLGVFLVVRQQPGDQSIALVGRAVGNERAKIVGRRQQTPDVQVGASGEHRVRDERRLRHARLREIRGDEPIGRTAPCGPDDRGQHRRLERERRLPGRGRRRGGGRRSRALIDPSLQEGDLFVAQRQFVERHAIPDGAFDPLDHHAARRAARPDHGAILAAVEHVAVAWRATGHPCACPGCDTRDSSRRGSAERRARNRPALQAARRAPQPAASFAARVMHSTLKASRQPHAAARARARSSEYRDGQNGRGAANGARDRAGADQLTHGEGSLKRLVYSPPVVSRQVYWHDCELRPEPAKAANVSARRRNTSSPAAPDRPCISDTKDRNTAASSDRRQSS